MQFRAFYDNVLIYTPISAYFDVVKAKFSIKRLRKRQPICYVLWIDIATIRSSQDYNNTLAEEQFNATLPYIIR